ncbi:type II toxin-antitoxin system ParD family antitoxin [Pseudoroseomonas wenyumeiae]
MAQGRDDERACFLHLGDLVTFAAVFDFATLLPIQSRPACRRASLNVSLTQELTAYIGEQVASGRDRSASEVVRASLRLLQRDEPAGSAPPSPSPATPDGMDPGERRRGRQRSR